jgi:hypothetical protein
MAHHIFRRCLLVDIVPPAPVVFGGDFRLVVSPGLIAVYEVAGQNINGTVSEISTMSAIYVRPIPPGVDTGLGYYRLVQSAQEVYYPPISPGTPTGLGNYRVSVSPNLAV